MGQQREREGEAERGLLKVAPVVGDKLPPATQGFAKMSFLLSELLLITSRMRYIGGILNLEGWCS